MYPIINHINDVLPHIEGRDEIIVMEKDGYRVIDYVYQQNDTFNDPMRMECRGLIFDMDGKIIRRPFEKFFNYGEKDTFETVDWSKKHIVMDKRDGSMIAAFVLNGEVRFGTRAGITDHSLKAEERHLTEKVDAECQLLLSDGLTPIFEWTAHDNRIVLDYEESELRLLAIRNMVTGNYADWKVLELTSERMDIKLVDTFNMQLTPDNIQKLKEMSTGIEGFVVYFPHNQQRVKIKTDEYANLHRAVSYFHREDMILQVVLDNTYDDLLPSLSKDRQQKLVDYAVAVFYEIGLYEKAVELNVKRLSEQANGDRKTFAIEVQQTVDKRLMPAYFRILDGDDVRECVKKQVLKHPDLLTARWQV